MGNRYIDDDDIYNFEENEALSWRQPNQREDKNVYTNNERNPPTQKKFDILTEFDPVNTTNKNRYSEDVFFGEEKEALNWKKQYGDVSLIEDDINNNEKKDAQSQTREEIIDDLDRESDGTNLYEDIEAIWRLPVKKEEYTAYFSSTDTYNISESVRHNKNDDKGDKHKQDLSEFDPFNKSDRIRETRHNNNGDVQNINLLDDEESTLAWNNQIVKKNNEPEDEKELTWKPQNQKIEVHFNGNGNIEHEKKEILLPKQQTQKINELIIDFDPFNESVRDRGENIANSSSINNTFDISVWESFYDKKNDSVDNKTLGEIPVPVRKHAQTQKKGEIIIEFDPLSILDTIRETNHNKSDNKDDINLHDDDEMDALEWRQPIKKSEEHHSGNDDANNEFEKKETSPKKQHSHDEIVNEFDPFNTSDENRYVNMQVSKEKPVISWRDNDQVDDGPTRNNNPDATWVGPPQFSSLEILGEKKSHLKRIESNTYTHMNYKKYEDKIEIEIWGSYENIVEAKNQLNEHVQSLLGGRGYDQSRKYDKRNRQEFYSEPVPVNNKQELELKRKKEQELEIKRQKEQELELKRREENELEVKRKESELELKRKELELELKRKEELEFELKREEELDLELKRREELERKEELELELKRREELERKEELKLELKRKEEQELERKKEQELELKRKEEQEREEEIYLQRPGYSQRFPFNEFFVFPTTDLHISRFLGTKDEILNPVRTKYRCHIWHDSTLPGSNIIKIVGSSRESVDIATTRVKNLFIKTLASRSIPHATQVADSLLGVHHIVEQPHKPCEIRIVDPSARFYLYYLPFYEPKVKLIKPFYMPSDLYLEFFHEIRESNLKRIEDSLLRALETVHLLDEEIKMRVRFGHVCFTRIPLTKDFNNDATLTINELNEKVLKKTRTESKFATRIATEESQLIGLIEVLSGNDLGWFGSPNREFKIHATRKTNDKEWPCAFDVELRNGNESKHKKYDGKIGLWSAIIHDRNVLDINMSCLANEYSWKLQIKTAKRLFNTPPQENFINGLEICPQGRLIYSNTKDINVVSVYEKTKWKYQWNSDYIVEIVKYEFWEKLSKYNDIQGLPVYLREEPFVVSYGVNFYKKSWDNNFANNLDLDVGEAPEWHPQDIMDDLTEKGKTEGVDGLMNDINTFLSVLESKIPTPAEHELYDT